MAKARLLLSVAFISERKRINKVFRRRRRHTYTNHW